MSFIKKLASQTLLYGLSTMLGRFINFLLIIPQTKYLAKVEDYGSTTNAYATIAFLSIIFLLGMETAYFYFIRQGLNEKKLFSTIQKTLIFSSTLLSLFFGIILYFFVSNYPLFGKLDILFMMGILLFDALQSLAFAKLRLQEKALKFSSIKLIGIVLNITLNFLFLKYNFYFLEGFSPLNKILIANISASFLTFLLLSNSIFNLEKGFDYELLKKILKYSFPMILIGFAGIVNETLDRFLLGVMLPVEEAKYQSGIYGAFYKITMVMTMFVQAYRFAAEPLFFKQTDKNQNNKLMISLYWFTSVCNVIYLMCSIFKLPLSKLFIKNSEYFNDLSNMAIIPWLLAANLFLGIYYNLSIWYKLAGKPKYGAYISVSGAVLTIVLNIIFIPIYGFYACAVITAVVYGFMCVLTYFIGKNKYPIYWRILPILVIVLFTFCLNIIISYLSEKYHFSNIISAVLGLIVLSVVIFIFQPKEKNTNFA